MLPVVPVREDNGVIVIVLVRLAIGFVDHQGRAVPIHILTGIVAVGPVRAPLFLCVLRRLGCIEHLVHNLFPWRHGTLPKAHSAIVVACVVKEDAVRVNGSSASLELVPHFDVHLIGRVHVNDGDVEFAIDPDGAAGVEAVWVRAVDIAHIEMVRFAGSIHQRYIQDQQCG